VDEEENDRGDRLSGEALDAMLHCFEIDAPTGNTDSEVESLPSEFETSLLRRKGVWNCGYSALAKMNFFPSDRTAIWEGSASIILPMPMDNPQRNETGCQAPPSQKEIGTILLQKTSRRAIAFSEITHNIQAVNVLEANGSVSSILDWAINAKLDQGQQRAFEIFVATFVLTFFGKNTAQLQVPGESLMSENLEKERSKLEQLTEQEKRKSEQLICLLHGPGGSGKTAVIDLLIAYAREYCSYMEDFQFTSRTIVISAMSGVAATLIMGETTHGALHLNQTRQFTREQIDCWKDTRLLLVDEISFATRWQIEKIHENLCQLKENQAARYGGLHVVYAGDFRQLEPPGQGSKALYEEECQQFTDWINCYIELKGKHRFKQDPGWGALLGRCRNGKLSESDIKWINGRVLSGDNKTRTTKTPLPEDIRYATYHNRDRDAINAGLFVKRCEHLMQEMNHTNDSIMIFCSDLMAQDGTGVFKAFANSRALWEGCGEDDIKTARTSGRMDPVLKLWRGRNVMLPVNKNVAQGQANGSQTTVLKVVLKPGVQPQTVMLDRRIPVASVSAHQVEKIFLQHSNPRILPPVFCVEPESYNFTAKIPTPSAVRIKEGDRELIKMKGKQLPLLVNDATTGHKLQGSGVDNLFVHTWRNEQNWIYVVLSRVRTRAGLFCRKVLPTDLSKMAVPQGLTDMLKKLRERGPTYWTKEEYKERFE
jgi:hypothetical protein